MKQIIQNLFNGETTLVEVPRPKNQPGFLLINSSISVVSTGTERMLLDFGKANLIQKAKQQPDKVKQVIDKIKTDGLLSTTDTVRSKLDQPISLGYCNAGVVVESTVADFIKGDRVVSNGCHSETVSIAANLCSKIPDNVDNESAAFTALGAISLQGVRLLNPTIGETIVVTGLGLIGLMSIQILKANGCRVLGIDYDTIRCELANSFGAKVVNLSKGENPLAAANHFTRGRGVDGVLITASTKSNEPVHQAAAMCRKRGRIVLVGFTGLKLSRDDFYEKELSFQVSCSYGPGRYDPEYEDKGHDYPYGFVRWTEKRNFEAVLELMSEAKLDVRPLITHHFPFEDAIHAYDLISSNESSLGILLEYNQDGKDSLSETTIQLVPKIKKIGGVPTLSFIGAGNYAGSVLIPSFKKQLVNLKSIASSGGLSGTLNGKKFGFQQTTTDTNSIFQDDEIDIVVISTRHNTHAELIIEAIENDKHVFVEKPLALSLDELDSIRLSLTQHPTSMLMVDFNRRFSPFVIKMKELLSTINIPLAMVMTVNAGSIPVDHWTQDLAIGGGRIVGEACHFIDLLRHLAGFPISSYQRISMDSSTNDTVTLQLVFENGSIGTIHYFSNGSRVFPKERLEVFFDGKILQLDNFKQLKGFGTTEFDKMKKLRQDKGQLNCTAAFINAIQQGNTLPIPIEEILEVSRISIELSKKG
jgi:predicted dehydrogenase/threonine dehydrogenase-like Zn-dependent dehydrogenase